MENKIYKTEDRQISGEVSAQGDFLEGMAIVFDSISEPLAMEIKGETVIFREKISRTALDAVPMDSIICCADHDERFFLGISPTTLSLEKTDRGLLYRCLLPGTKKEVITERINRKEYTGNSFRFAIPEGTDTWEKAIDGTYLRTINKVSYIAHVGPVFRPAYTQTDIGLAKRSFEVCVKVEINSGESNGGEDDNSDDEEAARLAEMYRQSAEKIKELLKLRKRKLLC